MQPQRRTLLGDPAAPAVLNEVRSEIARLRAKPRIRRRDLEHLDDLLEECSQVLRPKHGRVT